MTASILPSCGAGELHSVDSSWIVELLIYSSTKSHAAFQTSKVILERSMAILYWRQDLASHYAENAQMSSTGYEKAETGILLSKNHIILLISTWLCSSRCKCAIAGNGLIDGHCARPDKVTCLPQLYDRIIR